MDENILGKTAHKVFKIKYHFVFCIKYRKDLWGGGFWSDGGFVGTVGEGINAEIIRKYIQNQGRKLGQLKLVDFF